MGTTGETNPFEGTWTILDTDGVTPFPSQTMLHIKAHDYERGVMEIAVTLPESARYDISDILFGNYDAEAQALIVPSVAFRGSNYGLTMHVPDSSVDPVCISGQWWLLAVARLPTTQGTWTGNETGGAQHEYGARPSEVVAA